MDPAAYLTPQYHHLMPQRRILCLKPDLRLEGRSQDGQSKDQERNHCALTLGDSLC
jgi:hypothetical protein